MKMRRLIWLGILLMAALVSASASANGPNTLYPKISRVTVRLFDPAGHLTAARVRFTDLQNQYYAPVGHLDSFAITFSRDQVAEEQDVVLAENRRFAYVDGEFEIDLPTGSIRVEVVKGFQHVFIDDTVMIHGIEGQELHFPLEKVYDLPEKGWYSGDVHVHHINPTSALLEMKAEDLNICNILISDFTKDHQLFRGDIEPISDSLHIVFLGQEYREDQLGHVNLLNLREGLVQPAREKRAHQYPLNLSASDFVHNQGGHISWAHFAAWPGLEGPLGLVLQKVDAVELLCTIDPFHPPIFASSVVPELPMNSGLRLWYRLLNCGLEIPITAGTDKMGNLVTVGANRVYAKVDGKLDYQGWIHALNAGRTFVSNSPFITLSVNGAEIGSHLHVDQGDSVRIRAAVWSQLPVDRLEIVSSGELVEAVVIPRGAGFAEIDLNLPIAESSWIAARSYRTRGDYLRRGLSLTTRRNLSPYQTEFNRYFGTLRAEAPFAHTSPVYVHLGKNPVYRSDDVQYFIKYLRNVIEWLEKEGDFPSESSKLEVKAKFEEGINAFRDLGKQ